MYAHTWCQRQGKATTNNMEHPGSGSITRRRLDLFSGRWLAMADTNIWQGTDSPAQFVVSIPYSFFHGIILIILQVRSTTTTTTTSNTYLLLIFWVPTPHWSPGADRSFSWLFCSWRHHISQSSAGEIAWLHGGSERCSRHGTYIHIITITRGLAVFRTGGNTIRTKLCNVMQQLHYLERYIRKVWRCMCLLCGTRCCGPVEAFRQSARQM